MDERWTRLASGSTFRYIEGFNLKRQSDDALRLDEQFSLNTR